MCSKLLEKSGQKVFPDDADVVNGLTNLSDVTEVIEHDFTNACDGGYIVVPENLGNKVFKLIKHALALNYRTLNLTIMALHVYLGDEPLTEGIKRCLMRVKGMTEKT